MYKSIRITSLYNSYYNIHGSFFKLIEDKNIIIQYNILYIKFH